MLIGMHDARQGILHVVGPEQGITQPGMVMVGGDSHTSTHGAFGNLSFGIGASEVLHTIATQTLWQRRPSTMRIRIDGPLAFWRTLPSDPEASFDRTIDLDARDIAPMVTWGTNPEHALPITGSVPDLA